MSNLVKTRKEYGTWETRFALGQIARVKYIHWVVSHDPDFAPHWWDYVSEIVIELFNFTSNDRFVLVHQGISFSTNKEANRIFNGSIHLEKLDFVIRRRQKSSQDLAEALYNHYVIDCFKKEDLALSSLSEKCY